VDRRAVSRRQLLKSVGVTVGGVALAGIPSPGLADDLDKIVIGAAESIDADGTLTVRTTRARVGIRFTDDATFLRGYTGRVQGLDQFVAGDEIVARGEWIGRTFRATSLTSLYRLIESRILRRSGNQLDTSAGILELLDITSPAEGYLYTPKPLALLSEGDSIGALAWRDPRRGHHIALRIGVRP
jgi:hypothetical protein